MLYNSNQHYCWINKNNDTNNTTSNINIIKQYAETVSHSGILNSITPTRNTSTAIPAGFPRDTSEKGGLMNQSKNNKPMWTASVSEKTIRWW